MSVEIVVVLYSRGSGYKLPNGLSSSEDMFVIFVVNHLLYKRFFDFET
jgi:hypothetical protein